MMCRPIPFSTTLYKWKYGFRVFITSEMSEVTGYILTKSLMIIQSHTLDVADKSYLAETIYGCVRIIFTLNFLKG